MNILTILLSLLAATGAYSDDSCLRFTKPDQSVLFLCGHEDSSRKNLFSYNDLKMCFVGSAQMLTDKINGGVFKNNKDGITEAVKITAYQITLNFWNHEGKTIKRTINKCE